jgi:hypothetical protein
MLLQDMCNISQQTVCTDPDLHHISQSVTSAHHQSLPPTRARSSYSRCEEEAAAAKEEEEQEQEDMLGLISEGEASDSDEEEEWEIVIVDGR